MNNNQTLFIDCCGYTTFSLNETAANGNTKFRGKFQEANAVNKNKRMYTYDVLAKNLEQLAETVAARGLYGELDHPTDSIIHLANTSHVVTKLWWEGNTLMGEGEILPTPSGMILKKLIEFGCRIGISSRGVGNGQTNSEGVLVIGESYKLITFDAVADPSTYAAFQEKVVGKREYFEPAVTNSSSIVEVAKPNYRSLISFFGLKVDHLVEGLKEGIRKQNKQNESLGDSGLGKKDPMDKGFPKMSDKDWDSYLANDKKRDNERAAANKIATQRKLRDFDDFVADVKPKRKKK